MKRGFQFVFGLGLALAAAPLSGQTVFGTTAGTLVTVDVTTGATANIETLSLPTDSYFNTLTWHPGEQQLYGIIYTVVGGIVTNHFMARIDPATAVVTMIVTFGEQATHLPVEGLTYVPTLGTFVASRGPSNGNTLTQDIITLSTSGVAAPLVTTSPAIDSDTLVYDTAHSLLFSIDPNGVNILRTINLVTGASSDVGAGISTLNGMAYSPFTNRLYGLDYRPSNNSLYVLDPSNSGLIATLTTSGDQLTSIAVAIPEPASWASFVGIVGLAVVVARRSVRGRAVSPLKLG